MTVQEVLDYYGGVAPTARALGINYVSVREWREKGKVPMGRQWEIQAKTAGALTAEREESRSTEGSAA